jgi:tetratricopeptide (TPR) repeat protein
MTKQDTQHLDYVYFQALIKNELSQTQIREHETHWAQCERCRVLAEILTAARAIAGRPSKTADAHPRKSDLTETIEKIMAADCSPREAADLLGHVGSCKRCFNHLESFFEEAFRPLGENIEDELQMYTGISIAKHALALRPPKSSWTAPLTDWIKKIIPEPIPKWGLATAGAVMCLLIVFGGIRYYQTSYRLNLSEKILKEHHRIFLEDTPRPSGGYAASGISVLMAPDTVSYLAQALDLTKKALDRGADKNRSQHLLARILIFQNQLAEADSVFNQMEAAAQNRAEVLNDRGVLEFQRQNWAAAANYFDAAIRADATFAEAYYNLALALSKQGQNASAVTLLNDFLKIEKDEGWKIAAREWLKRLNM